MSIKKPSIQYHQGWVELKEGFSSWKRLWLVLRGNELLLYKSGNRGEKSSWQCILDPRIVVKVASIENKNDFQFHLTSEGKKFRCVSENDRELWVAFIDGLAKGDFRRTNKLLPGQTTSVESAIEAWRQHQMAKPQTRCPSSSSIVDEGIGSCSGFSEDASNEVFNSGGPIRNHKFYNDVPGQARQQASPTWFFENCSRQMAEKVLDKGRQYGNVLMRESVTFKDNGSYVISLRRDIPGRCSEYEHFEVVQVAAGYQIRVENIHSPCHCLQDVINYFIKAAGASYTVPFLTNNLATIGLGPHYQSVIAMQSAASGETAQSPKPAPCKTWGPSSKNSSRATNTHGQANKTMSRGSSDNPFRDAAPASLRDVLRPRENDPTVVDAKTPTPPISRPAAPLPTQVQNHVQDETPSKPISSLEAQIAARAKLMSENRRPSVAEQENTPTHVTSVSPPPPPPVPSIIAKHVIPSPPPPPKHSVSFAPAPPPPPTVPHTPPAPPSHSHSMSYAPAAPSPSQRPTEPSVPAVPPAPPIPTAPLLTAPPAPRIPTSPPAPPVSAVPSAINGPSQAHNFRRISLPGPELSAQRAALRPVGSVVPGNKFGGQPTSSKSSNVPPQVKPKPGRRHSESELSPPVSISSPPAVSGIIEEEHPSVRDVKAMFDSGHSFPNGHTKPVTQKSIKPEAQATPQMTPEAPVQGAGLLRQVSNNTYANYRRSLSASTNTHPESGAYEVPAPKVGQRSRFAMQQQQKQLINDYYNVQHAWQPEQLTKDYVNTRGATVEDSGLHIWRQGLLTSNHTYTNETLVGDEKLHGKQKQLTKEYGGTGNANVEDEPLYEDLAQYYSDCRLKSDATSAVSAMQAPPPAGVSAQIFAPPVPPPNLVASPTQTFPFTSEPQEDFISSSKSREQFKRRLESLIGGSAVPITSPVSPPVNTHRNTPLPPIPTQESIYSEPEA